MTNVIHNIIDYLNRNNIEYEIKNNQLINVPAFSVSGAVVSVQIFHDSTNNILVIQVQADQPIPCSDTNMILEFLNVCNSDISIGKFFLCPRCNMLTYRHPFLLTDQSLTDAQISSFIGSAVQSFLEINDSIDGDRDARSEDEEEQS